MPFGRYFTVMRAADRMDAALLRTIYWDNAIIAFGERDDHRLSLSR